MDLVLVVAGQILEDHVQGDVEVAIVDFAFEILSEGAGGEVDFAVVPAQVLLTGGDQLGRGLGRIVLELEEDHVSQIPAGLGVSGPRIQSDSQCPERDCDRQHPNLANHAMSPFENGILSPSGRRASLEARPHIYFGDLSSAFNICSTRNGL